MRTALLSVPPRIVFSTRLSAKRGTPHPGNSEARRVSPPSPANADNEYHAHGGSFRPAAKRFLPPTFRKAPERLTLEIPKRAAFHSPAPQTQARNIMRTAALSVPPPHIVFFPPDFPQSVECLTPEIPKRAAFRRLAPRAQARNIMRTALLSVPPHSVFFPDFPQSAGAGCFPAGRRNPRVLFPTNALEYTPKAHSKQKRR